MKTQVYCTDCRNHGQIETAGSLYEFTGWTMECFCENKTGLVPREIDGKWYLLSICDLKTPTVEEIAYCLLSPQPLK